MLKLLVSDKKLFAAFKEYLDERIEDHHRSLEICEPDRVNFYQGQIKSLRELKKLDETLKAKDKEY